MKISEVRNLTIIFVTGFLLLSCIDQKADKNCETYAEAIDPDTAFVDWSMVKGLNNSFGSIDNKYIKRKVPNIEYSNSWDGVGWRGERISAQVVLWSDKDVKQVEFEFTPFKSASGSVIDASNAQARFVRYVLTDEYAEGCGYRKPEDFVVSLSADALDNVECFDISAKTTQPVWLTFNIPDSAEPGIYNGQVIMYAKGEKERRINISFEVQDELLPPAKEWMFHLDMWQHPSAVARVNKVPHWSEEHWEMLKVPMKMLADAGQKVITATLNKDPWNNQCFDSYEDMITWIKKTDGTWEYDYSIFDRWISFMMDLGVDKQINCFSMVPWNDEIHYKDEASGELITVSTRPGSKEFVELWTPFLISFREHLNEKGWLDITNIAMDERSPEDMKSTLNLLESVAPELGIALADNHKSYKEYPMLTDICLEQGEVFDEEDLKFRKKQGLISTYYVCCSNKFPNVYTFSDPAEASFIGWYTMAAGFDGFLHWSYNSWVENPLIDSRYRAWPAGETYMVYPGDRSSIRFERLLEGIQDAEKIRILKEKLSVRAETDKLERLNSKLAEFNITKAPESGTAQLVNEGKKLLNELSR